MDLSEGVEKMQSALTSLKEELAKIRAGQASPELIEQVSVEAYETKMPVSHVATISIPDARTIVIQPWDDSTVKAIEKALLAADIGMMPVVDGKIIRLSVPSLTTELREQYIKEMKEEVENSKIVIRGIRHKMIDGIDATSKDGGVSEDDVKRMKDEMEKEVKKAMDSIEQLAEAKEKTLMTV